MTTLCIRRFALAVGLTFALAHLGCVLLMLVLPRAIVIRFSNTLTYGVDWAPVARWQIPLWEAALGLVGVFILGWIAGAVVAAIYNLGATPKADRESARDRSTSASSR